MAGFRNGRSREMQGSRALDGSLKRVVGFALLYLACVSSVTGEGGFIAAGAVVAEM